MEEITEKEFHKDQLHSILVAYKEREWWRAKDRIGALSSSGGSWAWVALAEDPVGVVKLYDLGLGVPSKEMAKEQLTRAFKRTLVEGWWK